MACGARGERLRRSRGATVSLRDSWRILNFVIGMAISARPLAGGSTPLGVGSVVLTDAEYDDFGDPCGARNEPSDF